MNWLDKFYPNGARVRAMDGMNEMQEGHITTRTCDMQGRTDGIIVRFDDGSWCEYELSFLDEKGNYSKSFVEVL